MEQDYNRLLAATEKAKNRSEAAAVAFEEHVASHQCGSPKSVSGNRGQVQHEQRPKPLGGRTGGATAQGQGRAGGRSLLNLQLQEQDDNE